MGPNWSRNHCEIFLDLERSVNIVRNIIGAKPNLVCGGSPKICVLVEWKALDRVKSEL